MFTNDTIVLGMLIFLCTLLIILLRFLLKQKRRKQLHNTFIIILVLMLAWLGALILQILFMNRFNIHIKYFFNICYISLSFLPVSLLFMALSFEKNKVTFKKRHALLLIIPTLTVLLTWTNDFHHLIYKEYSVNLSTEYGWYFYVHSAYTDLLYVVALFILIKYAIKNSGFFSKQAILILIGVSFPLVINLLGSLKLIDISIYTTPIAFTVTIICLAFAIFKFDLFKITPIALQTIVDRISDSYIVINENDSISDFNETFIHTFQLKKQASIRGKNLKSIVQEYDLDIDAGKIYEGIHKIKDTNNIDVFELYVSKIDKYFNVEITSIISKNQFLGTLVLFKDITQHKKDMEIIKENQDMLVEKERLASLGQMVGGIAHSLKTPIFSISGGLEGLNDLVNEFDSSIEDPTVNDKDMHDIAGDMKNWLVKMRGQLSYMSEVITTVKGQAVNLSGDDIIEFTIEELFSHTSILMKHELQNALINLSIENKINNNIILKGNINSLVQVLNNLISNAIQAYKNVPNKSIELKAKLENNNIVISVKDYASGLPEIVKDKLFKEMITTKGKEGTGLGLFMSYSMIKAKFNGDMKFETSNKGTEFFIYIPLANYNV